MIYKPILINAPYGHRLQRKAFLFSCLRVLVCTDVSSLRNEIIVAENGTWKVILGDHHTQSIRLGDRALELRNVGGDKSKKCLISIYCGS